MTKKHRFRNFLSSIVGDHIHSDNSHLLDKKKGNNLRKVSHPLDYIIKIKCFSQLYRFCAFSLFA